MKNKVAMVTGGTSGIGKEIAIHLLELGFAVYIPGRSVDEAASSEAFKSYHESGSVIFCKSDLEKDTGIQKAVNSTLQEDKLDLLVHSAVYYVSGRVEKTSVLELDRSYRLNIRAPYILTQKLLPLLKAANGGIVFINSSIVKGKERPGLSAYTVSKAGLISFAGCLRQEVNKYGIRVLNVYMGKTDTPLQKKASLDAGSEYYPERMIKPKHAAKLICEAALAADDLECTDLHIRPSVPYDS